MTRAKGHMTCRPHPDIAAEQTRDPRARAWAFVFKCWQEKKAAPESRLDNAKERIKNDSRVYTRIP